MSLLGYRIPRTAHAKPSGDVNDRRTPAALFDAQHAVHRFTVDVAASASNARLPRYFDREADGLLQPWRGERVWCNPPFSDLTPWVAKAWNEMVDGCELVVMLLPATRTDQRWWSDMIEPFRDGKASFCGVLLSTRFLKGRPRFGMPDGMPTPLGGWRPPFGCVLVTWWRCP